MDQARRGLCGRLRRALASDSMRRRLDERCCASRGSRCANTDSYTGSDTDSGSDSDSGSNSGSGTSTSTSTSTESGARADANASTDTDTDAGPRARPSGLNQVHAVGCQGRCGHRGCV